MSSDTEYVMFIGLVATRTRLEVAVYVQCQSCLIQFSAIATVLWDITGFAFMCCSNTSAGLGRSEDFMSSDSTVQYSTA